MRTLNDGKWVDAVAVLNGRTVADLSEKELSALRNAWYESAKARGHFDALFALALEGEEGKGTGTPYVVSVPLSDNGGPRCVIRLYKSHGEMTVTVGVGNNDREVASNDEWPLFVPGAWCDVVLPMAQAALARADAVVAESQERDRLALVALLDPTRV